VRASGRRLLRCPRCPSTEALSWSDTAGHCVCGFTIPIEDGLLLYSSSIDLEAIAEVPARDRQAAGYLEHPKFPTQIARVERFLTASGSEPRESRVLELGCGPGPYTTRLAESGHSVIAVDFSVASLALNRQRMPLVLQPHVEFVRADLRQLQLAQESADLLMMCDFLQHLGDADTRRTFLERAFRWLRPGGRFYLTFFNYNLKNRVKRDRSGAFGVIPYERLTAPDVIAMLPANVRLLSISPMSLLQNARLDSLLAKLPGARLAARMIELTGSKR
jgi:SAM-dependent methyltransferase